MHSERIREKRKEDSNPIITRFSEQEHQQSTHEEKVRSMDDFTAAAA
jgi:hypothetical protein